MTKPRIDLLTKVIDLCRARGFVVESTITRNGLPTRVYNYGPLGTEMKRNLRERWWRIMVTARENIVGVESSIIHSVLESSKSVETVSSSDWLETARRTFRNDLFLSNCDHTSLAQQSLHLDLPFGVAQIGKCFHDNSDVDISPENSFIFSSAESEKMTVNYYFTNLNDEKYVIEYWERQRLRWWKRMANINRRFTSSVSTEESEHIISSRLVQFAFPWGNQAIETLRHRTDLGLCPDQNWQSLTEDGKPDVIEMTTSLDQAVLVYLLDAYEETDRPLSSGEIKSRKVLRLHTALAPIKVTIIMSLDTQSPEVFQIGKQLAKEFRQAGINTVFSNSIVDLEEQYAFQDEIGTPFIVTIHEATLANGIISLRNRDTSLQEFLHIAEVFQTIQSHLKF